MTDPALEGLVQVFTGEGKGKTTAALGAVLRALGHGLSVFIVYFMKGQPSGENSVLARLPNVAIARCGGAGFVDPENVQPGDREEARHALAEAREAILSGNYDLVVLDEINLAVAWKLIELDEVAGLIQDKPRKVELILTGRQAHPRLIELADLVTEMVNVKHPYERGVRARPGIEF